MSIEERYEDWEEMKDALCKALTEMSLLFSFALLSTTPELARDGMEYVKKAEALVKKARGETPAPSARRLLVSTTSCASFPKPVRKESE